ncbi:hypothetical protein P7C73_g2334, partial [Tremellales sp. Uapishka_1]
MRPKRAGKRGFTEDDDRSARSSKKGGKNKRDVTYETYDEALDGGVEMEEKGERYKDGEKAQRFYEKAAELYAKAFDFEHTFDAVYNQARVLYTLSTSFYLPPNAINHLESAINLYRLSTTLTDSSLLQMDAGYNLAQACADLADMVEDVDSDDVRAEEVRALREEGRVVLERVIGGQEEFLINARSTEGSAEGDEEEVEAEAGATEMEVDDTEKETFETHLPTPSALLDSTLLLATLTLSLWEAVTPPEQPPEAEQTAMRTLLDRIAPSVPPSRQAEADLTEIKILLTLDNLIWEMYHSPTSIQSLSGAIRALSALLASPMEDDSVRADILGTLSDTHLELASRCATLASPAEDIWSHTGEAIRYLTQALDLPMNASTPREYKPSILLNLSKASLFRASLKGTYEAARRNERQLLENATTYSARAMAGLGFGRKTAGLEIPFQRGWDTELLAREILLHQLRIAFFTGGGESSDLVDALRSVKEEERRIGRGDLRRYVLDLDLEQLSDEERMWWKGVERKLFD